VAAIVIASIILGLIIYSLLVYAFDQKNGRTMKYPEKITLYILLCHLFITLTLLIGTTREKQFGCQKIGGKDFRVQGNVNIFCTLSHMVLLFFFLASQMWFAIYSLCVFLISKYKWAHERLSQFSRIFHTSAWTVPSILVTLSLITESIASDISNGICFVPINNPVDIAVFFAAPLVASSAFSITLLAMAMCNFEETRREVRKSLYTHTDALATPKESPLSSEEHAVSAVHTNGKTTDSPLADSSSLHVQMNSFKAYLTKTFLFIIVYFAFNVLLFASFIFEANNYSQWYSAWHSTQCTDPNDTSCGTKSKLPTTEFEHRIFAVALLKHIVWNMLGTVAFIWICSPRGIFSCLSSWLFTPTTRKSNHL